MTDLLLEYLLCGFPVSSTTVRKSDEAMALTAQGRCPFCKALMSDETCPCWNKEND